jgi:hypothetical protein
LKIYSGLKKKDCATERTVAGSCRRFDRGNFLDFSFELEKQIDMKNIGISAIHVRGRVRVQFACFGRPSMNETRTDLLVVVSSVILQATPAPPHTHPHCSVL